MYRKQYLLLALTMILSPVSGIAGYREIVFDGKTMGTTYRITVVATDNRTAEGLHEKIEQTLDQIGTGSSEGMSIWAAPVPCCSNDCDTIRSTPRTCWMVDASGAVRNASTGSSACTIAGATANMISVTRR